MAAEGLTATQVCCRKYANRVEEQMDPEDMLRDYDTPKFWWREDAKTSNRMEITETSEMLLAIKEVFDAAISNALQVERNDRDLILELWPFLFSPSELNGMLDKKEDL